MNAGNLNEHISEITNSTGSGVYDPFTLGWSPIVLAVMGISVNCLPRVVPTCGSQFGRFEEFGLPILAIAGDTNAAMFGERVHFIPALWGLSSPINHPSAKCARLGL